MFNHFFNEAVPLEPLRRLITPRQILFFLPVPVSHTLPASSLKKSGRSSLFYAVPARSIPVVQSSLVNVNNWYEWRGTESSSSPSHYCCGFLPQKGSDLLVWAGIRPRLRSRTTLILLVSDACSLPLPLSHVHTHRHACKVCITIEAAISLNLIALKEKKVS